MNGARAIVIAAVAAFIVGCSVGLISGVLIMRFGPGGPQREWHHAGPRDRGPGRERGFMRGHMLDRLERSLDLTAAQRERIDSLIDEAHESQATSRESLHVRIHRELSPEQRERLRKIEQRFGRRGRHVMPPPPPPEPDEP